MDPRFGLPPEPIPSPPEGTPTDSVEVRIEATQAVVGRLVRRLVRDPARADDMAQQAMLAALARPAQAVRSPIAWLSGITRNLARKDRRGDARRARHERIAARPESVPSTGDLVVRLEERRALLAAVRSLEEPYREAILLRYFEGMAPRDIARTRGTPIDTVRSHLRRGLAKLRERLDANHAGDRRAWCVALIPFAREPGAMAGPSTTLVASLAAGLLITVGGVTWVASRDRDPASSGVSTEVASDALGSGTFPVDGSRPTLAAAPRATEQAPSPSGRAWIAGRVTAEGRAALGVRVTASSTDVPRTTRDRLEGYLVARTQGEVLATAVTDAAGTFRLEGLAPRLRVRVDALPAGALVGESRVVAPIDLTAAGLLLAVHATARLSGRVEPLTPSDTGVHLTFRSTAEDSASRGTSTWTRAAVETTVRAEADGRFSVSLPEGTYATSVFISGRVRWNVGAVGAPWSGEKVFVVGSTTGAVLRGTVSDTAGRPVAGARLGVAVSGAGAGSGVYSATSEADGTYRIVGLPDGKVGRVSAWAAGFGPLPIRSSDVPLVSGETATLDLRLPKEVVVSGRVLAADGAPVVGIDVAAFDQGGQGRVDLASDAEGRFRVGGLPADGINLAAQGPRGAAAALLEGITEGAQVERDLVLQPGRDVKGRVIDAESRPVPGALVSAKSTEVGTRLGVGLDMAGFVTTTETDGTFLLAGVLPADDWVFEARAQGASTLAADAVRTRVTLTEEPTPLVLRLARLGAIGGRVTDPDGHGIANAFLLLREKGGNRPRYELTGADGRYAFDGVPSGDATVEVTNLTRERPAAIATTTVVGGVRNEAVDLRVERTFLASGTILSADGTPVMGRQVVLELMDAPAGASASAYASTNDRGEFQATGLVPGTYRLRVGDQEVTPPLEAGTRGVQLAAAGPKWVEGDVTDPEGRPVGGFRLRTSTRHADSTIGSATDVVGGHFRIPAPAVQTTGSWWMSITAVRGEGGTPLDVLPVVVDSVPAASVRIRLATAHAIAGRVLGEDGSPVAGAILDAVPEGAVSPALHRAALATWMATSGPDGAFRVTGLPAGRALLRVGGRGPYLRTPAPVPVEAGASDIEIRLARGREIRGTVRGPDGEPAVGFEVTLLTEGAEPVPGRRAEVAADGSFRIEGVPPVTRVGLWIGQGPIAKTVSASMPMAVHDVEVGGEPVAIRLRRGVFVEGIAVGPDGEVVSHGEVVADLRGRDDVGERFFVGGHLDEQGRFRIGPMDPGPALLIYEVLFPRPMARWATRPPLPVVAPARDVRITVARAVTLRGRVRETAGAAGSAWWNPRAGNLSRLGTAIGPDGSFAVSAPVGTPGLLYVAIPEDDRYALREGLVAGADPVDLALEPGRRIEGRVTDFTGGRAELSVVARRGDLVCYGRTNPDGTFHIPSVPPGLYRVEIEFGPLTGGVDGVSAGATGIVIGATRR